MASVVDEHNQQILRQFTQQAEPFSKASSHFKQDTLRTFTDTVGVSPEDEALDIACGPGIITCAVASIAHRATGMDLVPAMLDEARKRQEEQELRNIEWKLGDVSNLPFDDASFSLVVTRYSFHHLLDPKSALREMVRVCRPGGRVAVADVTPEAGKTAAYDRLEQHRDPSHTHALSFEELQSLASDLPLEEIASVGYRLEAEVEMLLGGSFPPPGGAEIFRQLVANDVGVNALSIEAYRQGNEIHFSFPTSILVWVKK